ncbi:hypothetical protein C8R43DRAFT_961069 [Mycena crocata]|nr:hypothetical protein C8R43DRAFT_961069 [Mycena crocata]
MEDTLSPVDDSDSSVNKNKSPDIHPAADDSDGEVPDLLPADDSDEDDLPDFVLPAPSHDVHFRRHHSPADSPAVSDLPQGERITSYYVSQEAYATGFLRPTHISYDIACAYWSKVRAHPTSRRRIPAWHHQAHTASGQHQHHACRGVEKIDGEQVEALWAELNPVYYPEPGVGRVTIRAKL